MGQKVNPHGLRVGVIKDWDSRWYAKKADFGDMLVEDYNIRNFILKTLKPAGVPCVVMPRTESGSTSTAQSPVSSSAEAAQRSRS